MSDPIVVFKEKLAQELGAVFLDEIPPPAYVPNGSPVVRFYVPMEDGSEWWIAFRKDTIDLLDVGESVKKTCEKFYRQIEWHEKYKEHL